jgi:hypothetical protein
MIQYAHALYHFIIACFVNRRTGPCIQFSNDQGHQTWVRSFQCVEKFPFEFNYLVLCNLQAASEDLTGGKSTTFERSQFHCHTVSFTWAIQYQHEKHVHASFIFMRVILLYKSCLIHDLSLHYYHMWHIAEIHRFWLHTSHSFMHACTVFLKFNPTPKSQICHSVARLLHANTWHRPALKKFPVILNWPPQRIRSKSFKLFGSTYNQLSMITVTSHVILYWFPHITRSKALLRYVFRDWVLLWKFVPSLW